ncbi:Uu.00g116120.m01.CDS01 [Anthostomella pinea]|uniref:Uu.00g116120.m01.CDS01 n=1 Tax=Anthostomella pinea TaxID=933095 RepID=A0AAI8VG06_9PEZI|nr:Uu.00g116120.m01.CDS01 [Anthostomella pinea]
MAHMARQRVVALMRGGRELSGCIRLLQYKVRLLTPSTTRRFASRLSKPPAFTMTQYPGMGLPLRHNHQDRLGHYPIGAHDNCHGAQSGLLAVREVAMMLIMDRLTDKPDWDKKVFDEEIVARWRKEALEYPDESLWSQATSGKSIWNTSDGPLDHSTSGIPPLKGIMTAETFDYCVQELRSKAKYYATSGVIPTLDAYASVVKLDSLADHSTSPDWHPNTGDMVQDLIHPSMYPLVYGRSTVLREEVVGVNDSIARWAGKGDIIAKDEHEPTDPDGFSNVVPPSFWSDTYQWLPSNISFQEGGGAKFTSYINNLHPTRHSDVYRTIEKLVERALPAWDQA